MIFEDEGIMQSVHVGIFVIRYSRYHSLSIKSIPVFFVVLLSYLCTCMVSCMIFFAFSSAVPYNLFVTFQDSQVENYWFRLEQVRPAKEDYRFVLDPNPNHISY